MNETDDIRPQPQDTGQPDGATDRQPARERAGPDPEVLRLLRTLAAYCRDSEAGYRLAYESADDRELRIEFGRLVDEREEMARQLDRAFRELGEEPPAHGTVLGAAHRIFLGLKAAIAGRDREEILEEIVRGESVFEGTYDALLRRDLPSAVEATIRDQHRSVREARDHFRSQLPQDRQHARHRRHHGRHGASRVVHMVEKNPTVSCAVLAAVATGFAAGLWLMREPSRSHYRMRR